MKKPPIKAIVRLVLSGVILFAVFRIVGGEQILDALGRVRLIPWLAALAGFLVLHVLSAAKWRFFLGLAGARLTMLASVKCYSAGLFANLCLPSLVGGDVIRAGLAMRLTDEKEAVLLGSVVDRLSDVLALGLLVACGMIAAPAAAKQVHQGAVSGFLVFSILLGCAVAGGITAWYLMTRVPLRKLPKKLARFSIKVLRALRAVRGRPAQVALGLLFCFGLQSGFVVINIGLGDMMGMDLDVRLWFLLWPLAKIAAMLPVSLGGLGVREAAFGVLVKPFLDSKLAVAESLVWQSVLIAGGLLAGAYWLASGLRLSEGTPASEHARS